MAEPTKFLVENEAISQGGGFGNLFDFSSGGNIFSVPESILAGSGVSGFGMPSGGFLSGAQPNFFASGPVGDLSSLFSGNVGSFLPSDLSLGGISGVGNFNLEGGNFGSIVTLPPFVVTPEPNFNTLGIETQLPPFTFPFDGGGSTADTSDIIKMTPMVVTAEPITTASVSITQPVTTTFEIFTEATGEVITLPPFVVTERPFTTTSLTTTAPVNIFNFPTTAITTEQIVTLPPFVVTEQRITTTPLILTTPPVSFTTSPATQETSDVVTLTPYIVRESPITTTQLVLTTPVNIFTAPTGTSQTEGVVTMTPYIVRESPITTTPLVITTPINVFTTPPRTETDEVVTMTPYIVRESPITTGSFPTTPAVSVSFTTVPPVTLTPFTFSTIFTTAVPTPSPTFQPPPPPTAGPIFGGGTTTPTTGGTMSAQRDFEAELAKTLAGLQKYQPQIQQMYGDLYKQFMPAGITAAEPGVINQFQQDLARLQQRQAGMLAPEDVRQAQQSAREAYGARGQVMGPGAIGAEILNREAIRQQREEQARQALQQSYGNILGMANLQTGNIFSPIASLMSGTFNPLGAYPADVYGTNVNAQLARDIAQKNYEAAIRSAELTGAASKSASNTGLLGSLIQAGGSVKIALACMPGDQVIDTPTGPVAIEDIKGGDEVVGYDGTVVKVMQVSSYAQEADRDFFTFRLSNGGKITVCDRHKILDIPASEWIVGSKMGDAIIEGIDRKNGVATSYDLVTEVGGYQIAGIPVNSMIPEMLAATLQLVALKNHV